MSTEMKGSLITPSKYEVVMGKQVNRIAVGTARVAAEKVGGEIRPRRDRDSWEVDIFRYWLGMGFNFIDTASMYGDAEIIIGEAIKTHKRENLVIATKVGKVPMAPDLIRESIKESVKRLGTPPDIIFIHDRWSGMMGMEMKKCMQELDRAVDEGLARGIGISNFKPEELEMAIDTAQHKIVAYQGKVNLTNPRGDAAQLIEICRENGIITFWGDRGDLNSRPLPPQGSALAN